MKTSEIIKEYGDIVIPDAVLVNLGIMSNDRMMDAEEVKKVSGMKDLSQAYRLIKKLKSKAGYNYDEAKIPVSVFNKYYGTKII